MFVMRKSVANLLDRVSVDDVRLSLTDSSSSGRRGRQRRRRLGTAATAEFTVSVSEDEYGGDIDELSRHVDSMASNSTNLLQEMDAVAEDDGAPTDFLALTVVSVETIQVTRPPTSSPSSDGNTDDERESSSMHTIAFPV